MEECLKKKREHVIKHKRWINIESNLKKKKLKIKENILEILEESTRESLEQVVCKSDSTLEKVSFSARPYLEHDKDWRDFVFGAIAVVVTGVLMVYMYNTFNKTNEKVEQEMDTAIITLRTAAARAATTTPQPKTLLKPLSTTKLLSV